MPKSFHINVIPYSINTLHFKLPKKRVKHNSKNICIFDSMEVQVNIKFKQLLKIVKTLPKRQLDQLLDEIEREKTIKKSESLLEELLLKGPVATKKQLETITKNRNSINLWRTV